MKKHDIKYIIKRVIIGVLIVLIVGFINKCSVKADSPTTTYYFYNSNITTTEPTNKVLVDTLHFNNGITLYVYANNYDGVITYYDIQNDIFSLYTLSYAHLNTDKKNIVFNIDSNNTNSNSNPINIKIYDDDINDSTNMSFLSGQSHFLSFSFSSLLDLYNEVNFDSNRVSLRNYTLGAKQLNVVEGAGLSYSYFYNSSYYQDYYINNTNFDSIVINNVSQQIGLNNVPNYYSQINLTDYQAVYFVPKNYSNVNTITNSRDDLVIPFNYYYTGNFTEGYFPLNDFSKIVFFYYPYNNNYNGISYTSSWFPLTQTIDDTDYDYNAFIIENNDFKVVSDKDSFIYYDSRYFDYYLVENMSDYNEIISIINKNNDSENVNVSITDSMQQLWTQGMQTSTGVFSSMLDSISNTYANSVLSEYFSLIKLPFDLFMSINVDSCESIEVPLPFVNGNVTLPCISSILSEKVPLIFNAIKIIINGLIAYRLIIFNLETFRVNLDPDNTKLEVLDL